MKSPDDTHSVCSVRLDCGLYPSLRSALDAASINYRKIDSAPSARRVWVAVERA